MLMLNALHITIKNNDSAQTEKEGEKRWHKRKTNKLADDAMDGINILMDVKIKKRRKLYNKGREK